MTTTTGQAFVMPLEDKKSTMVVEEVPMIAKVTEKGAEAAKKGVASGKYKEEDEELERKDRGHVGLEDKNDEEVGGRGGDDHMEVEEAKMDGKLRILGVVEATKNDDSGEITKDIEFFGSMLEASVMLGVEKEKDNSELRDGTNFLASHDEVEGEDKSELLKEEQQKEESGVIVEAKVEGDVESIVVEEEKPEPNGQKGGDVGFGGRDGGNFIEEKVTKDSNVRIEAVELDVNVAPFPKANDALGYDKEAPNDTMVVGGEEIPKESIGNDTNIEYETTKSEQGNKTGTMVIASEAKDEVGIASEEEVAYKVSDDVEYTMIDKQKQKKEGEKNEEVGSLGGDDGELKGKDVDVLVLSVEAIEIEDKIASLAETSEKFSYAMQGSNNIVDVNEGSVPDVTLGSTYHMPKDISKNYNVEGQATASETEEEVHVVLEMPVVEKVENDERYLLDKDVKPKLESAKSEDIGSGGSDGGKLDEDKEAKDSVASMFVESQVVNGRSIDGVDLACEDSMLMGSSEKNRNTEDQTTENELKEEVNVVLESNVTYKVSDDTEFDMAEDEKGEPDGEKSEEMEYVGGNGGKLDRGKDIKVFTDSVEVIELEDKLVPLAETNEKFGYVKEGSDAAVVNVINLIIASIQHVNEGNAYEVTPASAYSMLEDISKKEHSVDSQATSSEVDKVGVVVEMYVADKLPIDAKSLLTKGEEGGSRGRDGSELDEEKEVEVSVVTTAFVEPEADAMVVNDRIIGEFSLASEDTMLVGSPKKKQNFEAQTTSNEIKEEIHVVGDSSMDGEKKAKAEGKNSEDIGFVSGNGSELGEGKDVEVLPVTIEDTKLEQKLAHLGETNENFGYAEERSDDLVDVNKGSVEVVIPTSTCSLPEGISKKKHNVEGHATTSEAEEELGVVMDMYVLDKMSDDPKTLLAKEEKPILEGMENEDVDSRAWDGVEFDEEKEAEVSIPSIVFVEPKASAMVVINKSIDEVDLPCEDSVSVGSLENKQSAKGQITKIEVKEEVHVVVEPEVVNKVSDDMESNMDDEEKSKPECDKGEEIGSIGGNVGDLDEEKDIEVFSVSVEAIELKDKIGPIDESNENFGYEKEGSDDIVDLSEGSVEDVTPASVFSAPEHIFKKGYNVEGQATVSGAIVEMYVAEEVSDYAKSLLINKKKPNLEGEQGREIGSQGRDGSELDEAREVEVSIVSIGFVQPEACAMVENDSSIEKVGLASEDGVPMDCPEKKHSDESQITESEVQEEVHVVVELEVIDKVPNDTDSNMSNEEKPEPQGEKSEEIGSIGGNGSELDECKDIEAIELKDKFGPLAETNEKFRYEKEGSDDMVVEKDRSTEDVALANEDDVLVDCPEMRQSDESQITKIEVHEEVHVVVEPEVINMVHNDTYSYMADEEMLEPQGEKSEEIGSIGGNGGEFDEGRDIKVDSISIAAIELKDQLGPLDETNEKFGYEKEGSDDIVDVNEGSVEEVTPSSVFSALEDIFKECNVESRTTTSDAKEDVCAIPEMSVAENMPDDAKSLLATEEKSKLEGVEGKKIGSRGRDGAELDEEGEVKVSVVSIAFVEPEANAVVENDRSTEEVALANEDDVLVDCPEMKQSDERQITEIEVHEEVHVVVEPEVINKVHNDTYSYMADEDMPKPQGEKSEEIKSVGRNGSELDEGKEIEAISISIEAIELKDQLGPLAETIEKIGYEKEGSGDIVQVNEGSVEEVTPASVFSALEDIYKEYNAKDRTTMSDAKEDVCAIAETSVAENMPDYVKSLLPMEDKSKLECVEGKKIGSRGRDGAELDEEGEVEVSVVSIAIVELEAGAMVENDRSTEEVALANEDDVLVDCPEMKQGNESQITEIEVHEEVNVVVESEVINMVHNDTYSCMADEEIPEPQGEKSEEIGSLGGNGRELDERKDIEVISVSVEAIELNDKLGPLVDANEKTGYEKEGSNDIVEEEPKQKGVKGEKGDSRVWDGVELGEEKEVEVYVDGFVFVEQETCAMVVNDRTKEEVDLACEDIVLMGRPEKKQNTESHMVEEEKAEGEKGEEKGFVGGNGGELDEEKDVEVFTVSDEVTELEDNLAHLSGTNEQVGYVKEESDDIVVSDHHQSYSTTNSVCAIMNVINSIVAPIQVMDERSVERVTPESSYYVLEDISKKDNSVEGHATTSEAEDIGVVVEMYVASNMPDDVKSLIAKEENPKLEGLKVEEVGYVGRGGGGLDEKEDEVFVASAVFFEPDGKIASFSEANDDMGFEKKESDDRVVAGQEEAPKESMDKDISVEEHATNLKLSSDAITVVGQHHQCNFIVSNVGANMNVQNSIYALIQVMDDETGDEVAPSSAYRIVESSSNKEHNVEGQENASEAREEVCVVMKAEVMDKVSDDMEHVVVDEENTILEGEKGKEKVELEGDRSEEVSSICGDGDESDKEKKDKVSVVNIEAIQFEHKLASIAETNFKLGYEKKIRDDIVVVGDEEVPKEPTKKDIDIEKETSNPEPSSEASTMVVNDGSLDELAPTSADSVLECSPIKELNFEAQSIASEAMKDVGVEKPSKNVIISSQDGSKILTMDRPAGPGSLAPSLRPTTPNLLVSSELAAIIANPTEGMTEEERKLHDKVELIRLKFMRLVYSLGATPNEMVVTQVLYRLGLAEGIMHGRQTKQASDLNNAWKKAMSLEGEGKNDLNFSCNILVLGKTGVGKSATINSIFGKEKSKTDAFNLATTSVQEIVGDVHGVKIRIIDTPGLQPSVMDQGSNRKVLAAIKKYTKKCPPDIVLYVDRLDCLSCDLNDLPLLKTITSVLGPSIWLNAIVALTHAASAPEDLNGAHITYEVLMAQTSHIIQKSIRQATGDMNLMNPVAFAENHSSCQRNHEDQKVLPNGERWRHQILLLCYSAKILSEANSLVKLNDPNHGKLFGLCFRSLPLHFLMSSLLEPRAYPKLSTKLGGDSDIKLDDYSDLKQDDDEQEYDQLPKQQKNAYFSEEVKIPPSFDCDNPTYRYRFLEPTSTFIARPVLDAHGWDHDCGYDGVSMEETLAILNMFPANVAVHVTKDKKEFTIHLDSSVAAKHGENASLFACLDIQTIGHQLAYILRGETKIKSIKKNKTTGGFLVTFLGDTVATGVKLEDKISPGKRLSLVASTGAIRAQGDTGYGANLEACLKGKANPIGQSLSTLGISLMRWRQDLALGANLQSQFSTGRGSKMELRLGLNNKLSGQIGVNTSTSEQIQIALLGLVPIAASIYKRLQPSEPSLA
ncbi:hypothetical protein HU200_007947 [Digitaria exilis]|uniref:AIG1-type G domain-containing protein n=1 Tax=Digitaria exilis TaxID=1010633 RepID=A0A835FM01_9POAL|nr:hypothetical protein HU200_007947 [Digitaria exilis]